MAGIYNRDNINYSNIMDNFIKNRNERAKIAADNIRKQGEIWSGAVKNLADIGTRAYDAYQAEEEADELEKKLKELEERRDSLIRAESTYEQERYNPTSFDYQSRNKTTNTPNRSYSVAAMAHANPDNYYEIGSNPEYNSNFTTKEHWLQEHPGKTEDDYNEYVKYMNAIYGGV